MMLPHDSLCAAHEHLIQTFAELTRLTAVAEGEQLERLIGVARLITRASHELGDFSRAHRRRGLGGEAGIGGAAGHADSISGVRAD
jgi:hypothetical protein